MPERKPLPRETFDAVWKLGTNGAMPGWTAKRLSLGREKTVAGGGASWRLAFHAEADECELSTMVFAFEEGRRKRNLTAKQRLVRYAFLLGIAERLRKMGYRGDVEGDGGVGLVFHKQLSNVAAIQREIHTLDRMKLGNSRRSTSRK